MSPGATPGSAKLFRVSYNRIYVSTLVLRASHITCPSHRIQSAFLASSRALTMKAAALRRWESLIARLDPVPPICKTDPQELLTLLQSSFHKHLNQNHPSIQQRPKTATETHLLTILSSPHFNNIPNRHIRSASRPGNVSQRANLGQIRNIAESPMTHFSNCVSAGTATCQIASACLKFEFQKALALSKVRPQESLKSSGAGTTVLNWLYSSSPGLSFLRNHDLRKALIPFIIAEGKEGLIWEWMRELKTHADNQSRSPSYQRAIRTTQSSTCRDRFTFEILLGQGLNSAIDLFSQTAQKISLLAGNLTVQDMINYFIGKVAKCSTIEGHSIDTLIQIIDTWDSDPQYRRFQVELHRPQGPDVVSALTLLRQYPVERILEDCAQRREDLIHLSLRLADLLLQDGSDNAMASATWVMNFLQAHFAAEVNSELREH